jgi:hypothetical protein
VTGDTLLKANPPGCFQIDDVGVHLTVMCPANAATLPPGSLLWSVSTPTNRHLVPENLSSLKPVGEWNDLTLDVRGQNVRIVINDIEVQNVSLSKVRPQEHPLPGLNRLAGRIGIYKARGETRYRNIEICELAPSKLAADAKGKPSPYIVSKWRFNVFGFPERVISLYSNGRIDSPNSSSLWAQYGNTLVFRWPDPKPPEGFWVDTCSLTPNGQQFNGKNQQNRPVSGVKVND